MTWHHLVEAYLNLSLPRLRSTRRTNFGPNILPFYMVCLKARVSRARCGGVRASYTFQP